ncbi:hypothetical protein [Marisediminicola sp. LYQ85]|uniref:hypothetical protein n=1 Tax=Marisediminicola sp. LYQ85 TaxID=3391062 RepID=UPI0039839D80
MARLRDDNDDALSWGDEIGDPSHIDHEADAAVPGLEGGPTDPDTTSDRGTGSGPESASATGSVLLVVYGVLAGAYLLFTVGWVIAIQGSVFVASNLFIDIMFQFGEFLSIASPALWFTATLLLTRRRRAIARVGWLVAGLVIVAPWPFIVSGAGI